MTSAAYGVSRDSIANGVAERCQVSAFFAATAQLGGLPGEESRTRHAPSERDALGIQVGQPVQRLGRPSTELRTYTLAQLPM